MTTLQAKETLTPPSSYAAGAPSRSRRKVAASRKSDRATATTQLLQQAVSIDEWDVWQFEDGGYDDEAAGQRQEKEYVLLKKPDTTASAQRVAGAPPRALILFYETVEAGYPARYEVRASFDLSPASAKVALKRLRKPSAGSVAYLPKGYPVLYIGLVLLMALLLWALLTGMI